MEWRKSLFKNVLNSSIFMLLATAQIFCVTKGDKARIPKESYKYELMNSHMAVSFIGHIENFV